MGAVKRKIHEEMTKYCSDQGLVVQNLSLYIDTLLSTLAASNMFSQFFFTSNNDQFNDGMQKLFDMFSYVCCPLEFKFETLVTAPFLKVS